MQDLNSIKKQLQEKRDKALADEIQNGMKRTHLLSEVLTAEIEGIELAEKENKELKESYAEIISEGYIAGIINRQKKLAKQELIRDAEKKGAIYEGGFIIQLEDWQSLKKRHGVM